VEKEVLVQWGLQDYQVNQVSMGCQEKRVILGLLDTEEQVKGEIMEMLDCPVNLDCQVYKEVKVA
jgi:hypothetical protein